MYKITASLLLATTAAFASQVASADTILGIYASADYWQYDGSGSFADANSAPRDFSFDSQQKPNMTLVLEHPIPLVPNLRLRHTDLPVSGKGDGAVAFKFGNQSFGSNATLSGDLSAVDATLYYEILDNVVSADVGINVKMLDGSITVKDTLLPLQKTVDLKYPIPMLYVSAGGKLPFTGFSAKADISNLSLSGSSVTDAQAEIQYDFIDNMALDIGLKAGYRILNIKLDDVKDIDADASFKGPYVGLQAHF